MSSGEIDNSKLEKNEWNDEWLTEQTVFVEQESTLMSMQCASKVNPASITTWKAGKCQSD